MCGAADEVLATLKDEYLKEREKQKEIVSLLGPVEDDKFALLVGLAKKITDYGAEKHIAAESTGSSVHVHVAVMPIYMYIGNSACCTFSKVTTCITGDTIDESYGVAVVFNEEEDDESHVGRKRGGENMIAHDDDIDKEDDDDMEGIEADYDEVLKTDVSKVCVNINCVSVGTSYPLHKRTNSVVTHNLQES